MAIYDVTVMVTDDENGRPSRWADLRLTIEADQVHNVASVVDAVERFMYHCAGAGKPFRITIHGERVSELKGPHGKAGEPGIRSHTMKRPGNVQRLCFAELKEFQKLWNVLARKGIVDAFGGAECRRVMRMWKRRGRHQALAAFICDVANTHAP